MNYGGHIKEISLKTITGDLGRNYYRDSEKHQDLIKKLLMYGLAQDDAFFVLMKMKKASIKNSLNVAS